MSIQRSVSYAELIGFVSGPAERAMTSDTVILSNLERGNVLTRAGPGICLRYVGRGRESYRIGGRGMSLGEAQVMIASNDSHAEVEVPSQDRRGTLGLCVLLTPKNDDIPWLAGPLLLSADCTDIGAIMQRRLDRLWKPSPAKQEIAAELVRDLRSAMPAVSRAILDQAASIDAAKPSTRFEMVRRANLARAFLHSVLDRQVTLDEIAREVGSSPFQLLRGFQKCFGMTPAEYHRRLRLEAVLERARERNLTLFSASQHFGFADGSSFSHAYRRTFGRAPVWSKRSTH